jgi:hypothetical protein
VGEPDVFDPKWHPVGVEDPNAGAGVRLPNPVLENNPPAGAGAGAPAKENSAGTGLGLSNIIVPGVGAPNNPGAAAGKPNPLFVGANVPRFPSEESSNRNSTVDSPATHFLAAASSF